MISASISSKQSNQRPPLRMPKLQLLVNSLLTATAAAETGHHMLVPVLAIAAFLLLCAFTIMGCALHSRQWRRLKAAGYKGRRNFSADPVIISIHQVQPGLIPDDEGTSSKSRELCIWQKGILMGEKCQLPDFSGVINYDSAGNLVAPGRPCFAISYK